MNSALLRSLVIYGVVLPIAVVVGWMLSTPLHLESMSVIGGVLFIILLPTILAHHYALLLFSWNALVNAFFLPGQAPFWTLMVTINVFMMVFYRVLQRRPLFIHVPSMTFSILAMALVVGMTAKFRGVGLRVFGSATFGGKQYFFIAMSLLGYFALASQPIPWDKVKRYTGYFYLSGLTAGVSHVIYYVPAAYFLYAVFPVSFAVGQYVAEYTGTMNRLGGFALAGAAVLYYMLALYGLRGIFNFRAIGKAAVFVAFFVLSMTGGYRSSMVLLLGLCAALFVLEGLIRTKWTLVTLVVGGLIFAALVPMARHLPDPIQRVLSVVSVFDVNPAIRSEAQGSVEWRKEMWLAVLPEAPDYFWLGKGYSLNPTDLFLTQQAMRRGLAPNYSSSLQVGDYHNGPLSVYMPFGFPGSVAFLVFIIATLRVLWLNYRHGPEPARVLNRFLLAFFFTKFIFFLTVFGSFHSDLPILTGVAGLSVALNRGVCRQPVREKKAAVATATSLGMAPSSA